MLVSALSTIWKATRIFILGELERHSVSHVHTITTRTTASVQVERLALLMQVEDLGQVTVTEHNAAAHESVRPVASDLLEALKDGRSQRASAELLHQFVVVDREQFARLIHTTRDIERCHDLAGRLGLGDLVLDVQVVDLGGSFVRHGV